MQRSVSRVKPEGTATTQLVRSSVQLNKHEVTGLFEDVPRLAGRNNKVTVCPV